MEQGRPEIEKTTVVSTAQEKPEKVQAEKTNLEKLQLKIGDLEKSMANLKIRYDEKLAVVKEKLRQARLKNIEVIERAKELDPLKYGKDLVAKVKSKFSKSEELIEATVIFHLAPEPAEYVRGKVLVGRDIVTIYDAELLDFPNHSDMGNSVVVHKMDKVVLARKHVVMWYTERS